MAARIEFVPRQRETEALTVHGLRFTYGPLFRYFRRRNLKKKYEIEPEWRTPGPQLTSGYEKTW